MRREAAGRRYSLKKAILYMIGTVAYYFITVLVLFILTVLLNTSFENIWSSAITVTIVSEILFLFYWTRRKAKRQR